MIKINVFYIFCIMTIFSSGVWADSVQDDLIQGNTIVPLQKQNVRLVSEEVRMSEDGKITADYILENRSNAAFTMKIGFLYRSLEPKDFKVFITKKPVNVYKRPISGKDEIIVKDKYSGMAYETLYWNVGFTAHEKKSVRLEYMGQWGSVLAEETALHFIFALKTGALWSGNIEKADFYIKMYKDAEQLLDNKKVNFKLFVNPPGYVKKNNQLEWHFKNWDPIENISIAVMEENNKLVNIFNNIVKHSEDILVGDKEFEK